MAGNIANVSFVNPLDPGGAAALQVQQQAIQRQQAIAQQLQGDSFKEDQVAPGSRVSWTQGLARLADALVAKNIYKKAQGQQVDIATKQGQMMGRMFGLDNSGIGRGDYVSPNGPSDNVSNSPQRQNPVAQIADQLAPQAQAEAQANPMPADSAVVPPQAAPQPQPPAPQPAPQEQGRAPMSLSGNPVQDYTDYSMNPEEYTKQLIQQHAPNDMAKAVAQANAALARGDVGTATALLQNIQKQNYIAPMNVRQGGMVYNPITKKIELQTAQAPEGSMVNYGPDGKPINIAPIEGGAAAIQTENAAKAVGSAAGDLVQVFDPATHQMVKVPKSAVLSGAANGQPPMAAAPPLGAGAAFDVTGKNSANAFQDISNGAADVPNRIYALKQMQTLTADPNSKFGAGSEGLNHFNSLLGTISQSTGIQFDPKAATNANEFQKWATQYSARSGQELGLSGSDARTQLAVHATPNGEMTRQALQSVVPQMIGIENAKQGYAQAANVWQQNHGPQSVQEFRTEWNKVYNPSIYTHMAQGPQAFAAWAKGLSKSDAAQVRQQYIQLKQLGALPQ